MHIKTGETKITGMEYSAPKTTGKEVITDGFKKSEVNQRLDADVMRELSKTLGAKDVDGFKGIERLARPMTAKEKADFKTYFPKLDVDKAVVTAEATPQYNCIAWTVGETQQWFWPPAMYPNLKEEEAFDKFYGSYGFKPAPEGEVARWRNAEGLTHGCVSGPGHGPTWESKCGAEARIQHGLEELEGDIYGKADAYYTQKGGLRTMTPYKLQEIPEEMKTNIKDKASKVKPEIKEKFEGFYKEWQEFRTSPKVKLSANPAVYCKTESFNEITKMGPDIIPLLMEKMSGGDFFCLQALENIGKASGGKRGVPKFELTSQEKNNSEQNKALLMLEQWAK